MYLDEIVQLNGRRHPERVALVAGDAVVTFGELRDRAWRLANVMRQHAQVGDRVGILAENVREYVEAYYGVTAAGMALTFLNYRLHAREWLWILDDAQASVLLVQAKFVGQIWPLLREHAPSVATVIVIDDGTDGGTDGGTPVVPSLPRYADVVAAAPADEPRRDFGEDDPAWLVYTSGTTGFPKGAKVTHRNITAAVLSSVIEYETQPDERTLIVFPLCHISGKTVPVTHLRGGRVVLTPTFEPHRWMQLVDEHRITSTALAPTMLGMILDHPSIDDHRLDSLTSIVCGAAALPVEVLRTALERFGPIFFSGFGMTEVGGNVLSMSKHDYVRAADGEEHLLGSCGVPTCLVDVMVVDGRMEECAVDAVGEIVVRGGQVFQGYFRNEAGTSEAFTGEWFHTGDLARRDAEGYYYVVDRKKDMIITGGENVYSREVEEVIYSHPAVVEVAVVGLPDPTWGENVTAFVVLRAGATATEDELIELVRSRLASYKKPRHVHFVDELPKTVTGKIMKRQIRDAFVGMS